MGHIRIRSRAKVEQVSAQIDGLAALSATELDQRWRTLFGAEGPSRIYGRLLPGALAYRRTERRSCRIGLNHHSPDL